MTDPKIENRLKALIAEERRALMKGQFDRISEIIEEKRALTQHLQTARLPPKRASELKDGLRRNQELYDQALAGIRNVASRLGDLNRLRRSMDTYDRQGQKQTIDAPVSNALERRA
ncbi:hypothetical protein [Pseudoponticoccus marisrubri]|uniref:Flagellar biosynthesis protein FlgN n=1 Tax=Pseudoponticoccus marisrubri TaxID=1685382 RepID=A0A0W7WGA0_9RHOB|nr:hypothetical protein [Pseudoponticoccus marisrubri]KUF09613.1 hypothetical protein AVJ23_17180 [Pseudoponticoccus marisrubri]